MSRLRKVMRARIEALVVATMAGDAGEVFEEEKISRGGCEDQAAPKADSRGSRARLRVT